MKLELEGRRALVTGAGSGIGRGVAMSLAREGVRLALAGRTQGPLEEVRAEASRVCGEEPLIFAVDLATQDGCRHTVEALTSDWGGVDILVNNAGGSRPLADDDEDVWEGSFALNFSAARRLSIGFSPAMQQRGWGRILNITGATVQKAMNAASPAKSALQSWSRSLAITLAPSGVTVNCIAPGRINSAQILERLHPTEESRRRFIAENIPMGRFGEPEDIGNLVAFLASDRAAYISGISIPVDGGMLRLSL